MAKLNSPCPPNWARSQVGIAKTAISAAIAGNHTTVHGWRLRRRCEFSRAQPHVSESDRVRP
jgi:hypothetical protein